MGDIFFPKRKTNSFVPFSFLPLPLLLSPSQTLNTVAQSDHSSVGLHKAPSITLCCVCFFLVLLSLVVVMCFLTNLVFNKTKAVTVITRSWRVLYLVLPQSLQSHLE